MIKNCKLCGREFKGQRTNSEYCSQSCYRDARREYERLKIQRRKERERRKNTEDNMTQIRNLAVEAREHGMSYGKYIEMLEKQKVTIRKNTTEL